MTPHKLQNLHNVEFSQQALVAFDKKTRNSVYGSRIVECEQRDKRIDMTNHKLCYTTFVKAHEDRHG